MSIGSPTVIAALSGVTGVGLAVGGVCVLFGPGWAMLVGALPLLSLSIILARGLLRAG